MKKQLPRILPPATADRIGKERTIQINHCRQPSCGNFGVPARHQPQKPDLSPDRDPAYAINSTAKGRIPSLRCKACGENPPVKSNASIVAEIDRLADGLWRAEEIASCPNPAVGRAVERGPALAFRVRRACGSRYVPFRGRRPTGGPRTPMRAMWAN